MQLRNIAIQAYNLSIAKTVKQNLIDYCEEGRIKRNIKENHIKVTSFVYLFFSAFLG